MFLKQIWGYMKLLFCQKGVVLTFFIILSFVVVNFLNNVWVYRGYDMVDMYHPMKILLLGDDSGATKYYFLQIIPLLVVLPGGFSMIKDKQTGMQIFYISKSGRIKYFVNKCIAIFLVSFIVFAVPLLLEVLLNCISFPMLATGDLSNNNVYDPVYRDLVSRYLFKDLFIAMPYLYAIVMNLLVSLAAGTLGLFVCAISLFGIKYKIFLFIPIYVLLNGLTLAAMIVGSVSFSVSYFDYLSLYNSTPKNEHAFLLFVLGMLVISFGMIGFKAKKDCI